MSVVTFVALETSTSAARTAGSLDLNALLGTAAGIVAAIATVVAAGVALWQVRRRRPPPPKIRPADRARFVERPQLTERVVELLRRPPQGGPVALTTALRGAGGFGKTRLAHHVSQLVESEFPGGILWVTLGQHLTAAALTAKVNDLALTITGERPTFVDLEHAASNLGQLLGTGKRKLLVVDDVWHPDQLRPFLSGGSGCTRLVTTRIDWVLPPDAVRVQVDAMAEVEALDLLCGGLDEGAPVVMARLLPSTGGWPLLLRLVNGRVRRMIELGSSLANAVARVESDLVAGGPAALDPALDVSDDSARSRAVSASLEASLQLLDAGGSKRIERYVELAVFPEDAEVPLSTLERYWGRTAGLAPTAVMALCMELADLSLVQDYRLSPPAHLRLHDVLRSYLVQRAGPEWLVALHRTLLDAHREALANVSDRADGRTAWWSMGDAEPYLWRHLFHHLLQATREGAASNELDSLACDLRWAEAKLRRLGPAALDADLGLARDRRAVRLREALTQDAHVLGPMQPEHALGATMLARLSGRQDLVDVVRPWGAKFGHPRLSPVWPLPDLPDPAFRRALTGHAGMVVAVAISPDGTWLASAGHDGSVRLWGAADGSLRTILTGHTDFVLAVAISSDGSWLASASRDGSVRLWGAADGSLRTTLTGHRGGVEAVAFSPDGSWLASGGYDGKVRLWDVADGSLRATLTGHRGGVEAVAISPDGSWLASAGEDESLRIWDVADGSLRATLTGHRAPRPPRGSGLVERWGLAVAISPDGTWLASAGDDLSVRLWDASAGSLRATLAHEGGVGAVAIGPDGSWLASAGEDRGLRLWDVADGSLRATLTGHGGPVRAVAISPDGSWLASAGDDRSVRLWDVADGSLRTTLTRHKGGVRAVAISPDGSWLATGDVAGSMRLWEVADGSLRATLTGHMPGVWAVAISPDGTWLATGDIAGSVRLWNLADGSLRATLTGHIPGVWAVAISPDGSWLATGDIAGSVRLWNLADGSLRATLTGHGGPVRAVAISPDGSWLASAGEDGSLRLWEVADGSLRSTLTGHAGLVHAVAISPDGSWLASAGHDRTLRLWELAACAAATALRFDSVVLACCWVPASPRPRLIFGSTAGLGMLELVTPQDPTA